MALPVVQFWPYSLFFLINWLRLLGSTLARGCVCPGDKVTYKCTIPGSRDGVRGGATLWRGTAFDCTSGQIFLLHARSPSSATCNNGNIVARGILDAYGTYTSQLNVTVTPDVAGKRVKCIYHDNYTQRISVEYSSQVPTIGPLTPPSRPWISNARLSLRELSFNWSPVDPDCPAISYNILSSNCGSCPTTTNHTNVTCTDAPINGSACTFAAQTVVCGSIVGNTSDPLTVITFYDKIEPARGNDDILSATENLQVHNSGTNMVYIVSIGSLTAALLISVVVFMTAIVIISKRSKARVREALERAGREGASQRDVTYQGATSATQSAGAINNRHNIARGDTRKESSVHYELLYDEPVPNDRAFNTRDNIAYGLTTTLM